MEHPAPAVVSFTGSSPVGEGITKKAGIKRVALELGGNGPFVVLDDADVDRAVAAAVFGSFFHQGQVRMIVNCIIIDTSVHDELVDKLVERTRALTVGDPNEEGPDLGLIINQSQLDSVLDKV